MQLLLLLNLKSHSVSCMLESLELVLHRFLFVFCLYIDRVETYENGIVIMKAFSLWHHYQVPSCYSNNPNFLKIFELMICVLILKRPKKSYSIIFLNFRNNDLRINNILFFFFFFTLTKAYTNKLILIVLKNILAIAAS